jgi:YidC/Oxa1 family membrane protein insertase
MEKRAFLAVALSLLILVIYQEWIVRQYGVAPAPTKETQEVEKVAPAPPKLESTSQKGGHVEPPVAAKAKDVVVETDNYIAVFTNDGARLKSFKFKNYRSSVDEKSGPYELVATNPGVPLPLGIRSSGPTGLDDSKVTYAVEGTDLKLSGDSQGVLLFKGQLTDGSVVTKKLTFKGSSYPIGVEVGARKSDGGQLPVELLLTVKSDHAVANPDAPFEGLLALVDHNVKRVSLEELTKGVQFTGDISWGGFGKTYFLFAVLTDNGAGHKLSAQQSGPAIVMSIGAQNGKVADGRYTLFAGPKELDVLQSAGKGLEGSINFGYFAIVSKPFLYILHFSHRFTGSYGIDIIILTILMKILTAPLTHKSFVSMKQMQKLGPQMERLKEKFKDDREKLNKEIMELYRRNGVNPLGGCLPMLLQFPIFIGLYNALSTPIELRHAPFLWIKDLSRPDWESLPFTLGNWHLGIPVLTVLMGASMFVQQWMTPSAGDPNQRRMMLMMPIIFTGMFVTFPAGLTIYWLVNNILTIGQQYWISRMEQK